MPHPAARLSQVPPNTINLADERLGARGVSATDEFFAPLARMLQASEPEWRAGVYDAHGKWMDGWETRRRRQSGHDYCIVRLAARCTLAALDIDTRHFTGNYPPDASVEGCAVEGEPDAATRWTTVLAPVALQGNQRNLFAVETPGVWTHLKLNIFPDGGVARLRAYGAVQRDWREDAAGATGAAGATAGGGDGEPQDLAAALNGGMALACSDEHYGSRHNLLLPGRGASMADGWETRRRREPGFDWVILRLGHPGRICRAIVDTAHFRGNFPHQVSLHGALLPPGDVADLTSRCLYWPALLEPQALAADREHVFEAQLRDVGAVSHVRVNLHPDGGLSRVKLFGRPGRD